MGGEWSSPPYYASTHGAKAVIAFSTFGTLANWEGSRWTQAEKGIVEFGPSQNLIKIPTITVTPRVISAIFTGEKSSGTALFNRTISGEPYESFELKGSKKVTASVATKSQDIHTQNVVGVLEGSDPVLKNEYVAIGAHYDHVGMNPFFPGEDKIWNGADDDGSGTVSVLSIAEAFAKGTQKPRRSILFIWHV